MKYRILCADLYSGVLAKGCCHANGDVNLRPVLAIVTVRIQRWWNTLGKERSYAKHHCANGKAQSDNSNDFHFRSGRVCNAVRYQFHRSGTFP